MLRNAVSRGLWKSTSPGVPGGCNNKVETSETPGREDATLPVLTSVVVLARWKKRSMGGVII